MFLRTNLKETYSPLYFLASLGNGGMAVAMFIYLMFMTPHPETPIPTFDTIRPLLTGNNLAVAALVAVALLGVLFFAFRHFWLLTWNLREYAGFRRTDAYHGMVQTNSEASLMAIPLTLAMSINVLFVLGALFVPGLWTYVEMLFPFSLTAFALVGALAIRIQGRYLSRMISGGHFDCARNNNLSQMIATFAFSMVAVGFAAPAAMSQSLTMAAIGAAGSIFFLAAALITGAVIFILGLRSMLEHGIDLEGSASLWILIPLMTLFGITLIRLSHGFHHHFGWHPTPAFYFVLLTGLISLQLLTGGLGYAVMRKVDYYGTFLGGPKRSTGSYSLICPGVAFFVLGMFFIHPGLVNTGLVAKFSLPYFVLVGALMLVQLKTIQVMFRLDRKLLNPRSDEPVSGQPAPVSA